MFRATSQIQNTRLIMDSRILTFLARAEGKFSYLIHDTLRDKSQTC